MVYTRANMIKDVQKRIKALEGQAEVSTGEYHKVVAELLEADQYLATLKATKVSLKGTKVC